MEHADISDAVATAESMTSTSKSPRRAKYMRNALIALFVAIASILLATVIVAILRAPVSQEQIDQYTLVPDKVSESATIAVALPPETTFANFDPATALLFSPEIKGKWDTSQAASAKIYRFLPEEKLAVGAFHMVTLNTPELKMEKMFSVDKDPSVLAVFPKEETEVNEYTNITVMFSRPMVPLSTLSENADIVPPVNITPVTQGRWKWITSRTLQFTPTTRLIRSAQYKVEVGTGFRSIDGVSVQPFAHSFTTRVLRQYELGNNAGNATTVRHDQPLRVYFNQPVDLERTRPLITLSTLASGITKSFVLAYGSRQVVDPESRKIKTYTDQSVLEIYPESDTHNRAYLWDFGESYAVTISGAVPIEGNMRLTGSWTRQINVNDLIESVTADSPRSNLVTPEFFDPLGTLKVTFSEAVNLSNSRITGKGIAKIAYEEKCVDPAVGEEVRVDSNCPKTADMERIIISFNAKDFGMSEKSTINFEKIVNTSGLTLNESTITREITMFPKFEILSTTPADGTVSASLSEMVICSTNPLTEPSDEEFYKKVRSNMMIGLWRWNRSFMVRPDYREASCPVNSFQTVIRYGLVPKYSYVLTLDLEDHFGGKETKIIHFTTTKASPLATGFSHLQGTVIMTSPDRAVLSYGLDFMNEIDVAVCRVGAEQMLTYRVNQPSIYDAASTLSCLETRRKHVTLPDSPATRKYLQLDIKEFFPEAIGNYIVVFSNPDYRRIERHWDYEAQKEVLEPAKQLFEKTYMSVTSLAVGSKQVERGDYYYGTGGDKERELFMKDKWPTNLYWVNDFKSLTAISGAAVTPFARQGDSIVRQSEARTDAEGIAETPSEDNVIGAVVSYGGESTIVSNLSDSLSYYVPNANPDRKEYLYTDRPIYRPGDTVHIKGIARIGYDGAFEVPKGETTIEVRDARYDTLRTEKVRYSENGTYEVEFALDKNAPLGYYSFGSESGGYGSFQVEEYVAPQFKVDVTPDQEEYVSGANATINIAANYYFGVPVQTGKVEYRIVAQDYYFDRYHDAYFNFGGDWYVNDNGWYGDQFLTRGALTLSKDGKAALKKELNIDKLFGENYRSGSKIVTVYVTVKNENGQSVSKQQSFIVHRGEFYAGLRLDDYFYETGKPGVMNVKTVDTKGIPVSESGLVVTLNKIDWKSYKRQEVDGNFYYRTEKVKQQISTAKISTDKNGDASYQFTTGDAGEYEFSIVGTDEQGNTVEAHSSFYVSGASAVNVRETNNATLELVAPKTDLAVGDTASFVIKSPYPHAKALVTIARGKIYERKVLDIQSQLARYQFPISEAYIPNVVASVLLLSPLPEIKYGEVNYSVGTQEKDLSITITPQKKRYLPGEEVTLDISALDNKGVPVSAELSLSVVDMSVLALVGNPKKDPVNFFYDSKPLTIRTAMNVKNILHVAEIPVGTKGGSGGGGNDLEKKKRGVFRDTAYWNGVVNTDANGKATVRFTLPDNLTEWQVESVGVTKNTKVGAGYSDFKTNKSVMALPLKPRFILPGDQFSVGGTIFNETEVAQRLNVSVTSGTLTFTGTHETTVIVEPHTSISVSFPVSAPESMNTGHHEFTLNAKNAEFEDVVSSTIPVEMNTTYEFTATAGRITESNWKEQLYIPKNVVSDRGSLTLSLSATMATVLDSAITGMIIYPYECSEQIGSKLRTIALVKQNAALFGTTSALLPPSVTIGTQEFTIDQVVANGLAKLYQNQSSDGGMPYYSDLRPDFRLTLATLETYADLSAAGYAIDSAKQSLAASYVANFINYPKDQTLTSEQIIASAYALTRVKNGPPLTPLIHTKLLSYANDKNVVSNLSNPALAYLVILSRKEGFGDAVSDRLLGEFENRSKIDARGTTVGHGSSMYSEYFNSTIADTAFALKAFATLKKQSPLIEGYVRAIRSGKARDGGWGSTYNTISVIDAMTEYLKWTNEANARMDVAVTFDQSALLHAVYAKENVRNSYATSVPMSKIKKGAIESVNFLKKDLGADVSAYYYDLLLKYYLPTAAIAPRDEGFSVSRSLYKQDDLSFARPVTTAMQGDVLHGRVVISVPAMRSHVSIEDFIPAGMEIVNQRLQTEDQGLSSNDSFAEQNDALPEAVVSQSWFGRNLGGLFSIGKNSAGPKKQTDGTLSDDAYGNKSTRIQPLYPTAIESHDDRVFVYIDQLAPGEYVYDYYLRALVPGVYQYLPLVVSEMYTPENFGRTGGGTFTVTK